MFGRFLSKWLLRKQSSKLRKIAVWRQTQGYQGQGASPANEGRGSFCDYRLHPMLVVSLGTSYSQAGHQTPAPSEHVSQWQVRQIWLYLMLSALECVPHATKGVQNRLPQGVPLWHINCFELKAIEILQAHKKLLLFLKKI